MKKTPPGKRPLDLELLLAPREHLEEKLQETVARLGELYLRKARLAPETVSAREIRLLRRSRWARLRAAAVVIWSQRRPRAFLGAAERFLTDEPDVRCGVLEGLANAAILEGRGPADPPLAKLLESALQDADPSVRASARETASLLHGH